MYDNPRRSGSPATVIVIVLSLVACLCLCVAVLGGGGAYLMVAVNNAATQLSTQVQPQLTSIFQPTSPSRRSGTPTASPQIVLTPVPTPVAGAEDTLQTLENAAIPPNDPREIAERLKHTGPIPEVVANALFLFHDLNTLFAWADSEEFRALFATVHGSPTAR